MLTPPSSVGHITENKEFSSDVIGDEKVAVILTQSWCPQWKDMKGWIEMAGVKVYYIEYDLEDDHRKIMQFKETVLGNDQVPYVRYYKNSLLVAETNWIPKHKFLEMFK